MKAPAWWCYALVYLVEAMIDWQYFSRVFSSKRPKWQVALLYAAGYGLSFAAFSTSTVFLNLAIQTVMQVALQMLSYHCSVKSAVFHAALLRGLSTATEYVAAVILGTILPGGFTQYLTSVTGLLLLTAFSKLLYFILTKVCLSLRKGREENSTEKLVPFLFGLFSLASLAVLVALGYIVIAFPLDRKTNLLVAACSLILLFANILLFVVHQYVQELNRRYLQLSLMRQKEKADQDYFQALNEHYSEQRILIHDIRRHLAVLRGIADEAENREIVEYISQLEELPELQKKIRYCNHSVLNVILARYGDECRKKGIAYSVDVRTSEIGNLASSDITALFGNLLENAVEAAERADEPYIELSLSEKQPQNTLLLSLVNSCPEKPEEDADGLFTRKGGGDRHGIGLKSVGRTVKKYGGSLKQYYAEDEKAFHTVAAIPFRKR